MVRLIGVALQHPRCKHSTPPNKWNTGNQLGSFQGVTTVIPDLSEATWVQMVVGSMTAGAAQAFAAVALSPVTMET